MKAGVRDQAIKFCLGRLSRSTGKFLLFCWLPLFCLTPAQAKTKTLGVVQSKDNVKQWETITERLQATNVDYCIVDAAGWQQESDLGNVQVLFFPNVATLDGAQALALNQWMNRGGQVIVSGPTGSLSQPEVRSQLRSLFGAYWGFPVTSPATIEPISAQEWIDGGELSATFKGGVIIPTDINSQTAAVWAADGKPPAVVVTPKTTFLGWRWGIDTVAPANLDTAWLQAALNRYGTFATAEGAQPQLCDGVERSQNIPQWQTSEAPSRRAVPLARTASPQAAPRISTSAAVAPSNSLGTSSNPTTGKVPPVSRPAPATSTKLPTAVRSGPATASPLIDEIQSQPSGAAARYTTNAPIHLEAMSHELEGLIGRFESALLSAEATHHDNGDRSTEEMVEQLLDNQDKASAQPVSNSSSARQAIAKAKEKLLAFQQLVNRREYAQARAVWLQAQRLLWENYPTDRPIAQPEVRAIWLDRGTIVRAKSSADLAKIFDRLAAAGINTVFFETVNASYPIYPSRVAPEQNPLTQGWDPLKAAVQLAHERDMELHAWVWIFAAANQRHNVILNQPANYLGPVLSRHPDWALTDSQRHAFHPNSQKAFFDPANPQVKRYLLSLLEEIATQYDIDGIQFDYIRYPFQDPTARQTYGYGAASRQQFKQLTGVDPVTLNPRHPMWRQWTIFRVQQIDDFVASASTVLKQKRPDLILSAAVFPIPRRDRIARLQQHWEEWARREYVDWIVPMTYAVSTEDLQQLTQPLFVDSEIGSTLLLPSIRLLNLPDAVAVDQMQLLRNLPTGGYALFAAENFTDQLQTIFRRTQGANGSRQEEPLPHRQPFAAAATRYHALQQEWRFLLVNKQLDIDEAALKDWGKQADSVAASLDRLADAPSTRHLLSAQIALSSFRRHLSHWMQQHAQKHPYQMEAWNNRLETLERLLSYGERTALKEDSSRVAERKARE